jgi:hypothetical protein
MDGTAGRHVGGGAKWGNLRRHLPLVAPLTVAKTCAGRRRRHTWRPPAREALNLDGARTQAVAFRRCRGRGARQSVGGVGVYSGEKILWVAYVERACASCPARGGTDRSSVVFSCCGVALASAAFVPLCCPDLARGYLSIYPYAMPSRGQVSVSPAAAARSDASDVYTCRRALLYCVRATA